MKVISNTQFNHLSIQGSRRLAAIDLDLRPLMTLIGANGIGKTSMLDVFSLLSASANSQLANKLLDLGGLSEILTREKTDSLSFKLSLTNGTSESLIYDLQSSIHAASPVVWEKWRRLGCLPLLFTRDRPTPF